MDIQVLTHCDPRRALRVCMMARSVPVDIRVLCAVNGLMEDVRARLGKLPIPPNLTFLPFQPEETYPTNRLRNRALEKASAEWIYYLDADFVFCAGFWQSVIRIRDIIVRKTGDRICLCPVALWDPAGAYLSCEPSTRLLEEETPDSHCPPVSWTQAQKAQLFKFHERYFGCDYGPTALPYNMTDRMRAIRTSYGAPEPWGFMKRRYMIWADESFRAGPMDKQQLVAGLLDRGINFFAVPNSFVFHLWHPDESGGWPDRNRNRALWARRWHVPHRYLLIGIGGVLPPHLPDALRSCLADGEAADMTPSSVRSASVETAIAEMENGNKVVVGPPYLAKEVLAYNYIVFVFFRPPEFYVSPADGQANAIPPRHNFAARFCNSDMDEAIARLENVALACDLSDTEACVSALRNATGLHVQSSWFRDDRLHPAEPGKILSEIQPEDYILYHYAKLIAR